MNESILITGARGFTGFHFERVAREKGYSLVFLNSNLLERDKLISELRGVSFNYVVHLAAISYVGHGNSAEIYDVNVIGTQNLLDAVLKSGKLPRKVLVASSANVYGNADCGVISEAVVPHPVNHYAISKLAMEYCVSTYFDRLPIILSRPFNYTGYGQDVRFVIPKIVDHFKRSAEVIQLGNIDVIREYNDVRFVCDAYLKLLTSEYSSDVFNVCTSKGYSLASVVDLLSEITGHSIEVSVNQEFIRPNEIARLLGDNSKLKRVVDGLVGYSLADTLNSMLEA